MIGDILVGLVLAILVYQPVLWVVRKLVRRVEVASDDIQKPIDKGVKNEKAKRRS